MDSTNIEHAVARFQSGAISVGRAALIAGLLREVFMQVLGERGIAVINQVPADLDAEIAVLRASKSET